MPDQPTPDPDDDLAEIARFAQAANNSGLPEAIRHGAAAEIRRISDREQE
ncbi:hypothetical protein [Actinacidiphila reveromycinica]|nr:hypothetical protein [Streptomyces sp. SN-593]